MRTKTPEERFPFKPDKEFKFENYLAVEKSPFMTGLFLPKPNPHNPSISSDSGFSKFNILRFSTGLRFTKPFFSVITVQFETLLESTQYRDMPKKLRLTRYMIIAI